MGNSSFVVDPVGFPFFRLGGDHKVIGSECQCFVFSCVNPDSILFIRFCFGFYIECIFCGEGDVQVLCRYGCGGCFRCCRLSVGDGVFISYVNGIGDCISFCLKFIGTRFFIDDTALCILVVGGICHFVGVFDFVMARECRSKGILYLFRGFIVVIALSSFAVEVCHKTTSMTDDFSILTYHFFIVVKHIIS